MMNGEDMEKVYGTMIRMLLTSKAFGKKESEEWEKERILFLSA
jgi:hypothetical protein